MRIPQLCLHKHSKQYYACIDGTTHYFGTVEAQAQGEYHALIAKWISGAPLYASASYPKIADIIPKYLDHLKIYYGQHPNSAVRPRRAVELLGEYCGHKRSDKFEMADLRMLQSVMNSKDDDGRHEWCRATVNAHMAAVTGFFVWAASQDLCPAEVASKCRIFPKLPKGRCDAREKPPVEAVDNAIVEATKPYLTPDLRALVTLQQLTGARPGELVRLTPSMIDRSKETWRVDFVDHKTAHHGQKRILFLGPKARALVAPLLLRPPDEPLFKPERAKAYTTQAYDMCIAKACKRNGMAHWSPNQIRHTVLTQIEETLGRERASAIAGHASMDTTNIYTAKRMAMAEQTAEAIG